MEYTIQWNDLCWCFEPRSSGEVNKHSPSLFRPSCKISKSKIDKIATKLICYWVLGIVCFTCRHCMSCRVVNDEWIVCAICVSKISYEHIIKVHGAKLKGIYERKRKKHIIPVKRNIINNCILKMTHALTAYNLKL